MTVVKEYKGTFPALPDSKYELVTSIWNKNHDISVRSTITNSQWKYMLSQLFADAPNAKVTVITSTDAIIGAEMQTVRIDDMKFRLCLDARQYIAAIEYRESITE